MIVRHTVNGDPLGGYYCYQCEFSTRDVVKAAKHDGSKTCSRCECQIDEDGCGCDPPGA